MDPFERAHHEAIDYGHWFIDRMFLIVPAGAYVAQWMQSFKELPPRQEPGSFRLDKVMKKLTSAKKD